LRNQAEAGRDSLTFSGAMSGYSASSLSEETAMAKGQKKSNKEARKPKKETPKTSAPVSVFSPEGKKR